MASNFCFSFSSCITLLLILLCLLSSRSSADLSPNTTASTPTICKYTPYPSFCRSVLPTNDSANAHDFSQFSLRKSLSYSRKFLSLINKYLRRSSFLTPTAVAALRDCRFLAELNRDFLLSSFKTVNTTSRSLPAVKAEDVQTLLSAILTNTQTCLDGLRETASFWSVKNGLYTPLANDTKLYSVSLALFTKVWVSKKKKGTWKPSRKQFPFRNGFPNFSMSRRNLEIFESVSRRKLLRTSGEASDGEDQVLVSDIVIVGQNGLFNFTTIGDAVASAPNNTNSSGGYYLIYITAGLYEEYISIAKNQKYLMMIGEGINRTVITGNHSFVDGWTTYNSSTFAVVGEGFVAVNITFRNTAGPIKHQAVAVRNGADLSTFFSCSFEGYQDTLYVHSLRQFYRQCDIYGTVDFIFGNAAAVFQHCNIYTRLPLEKQFDAITAQGRTDPNQNTGISIQNCTIRATEELTTSNYTVETYLGRPWKLYSRTVYMQSFMDSSIHPLGWTPWNGDFALNTSYYAEFNNSGPGSNTTGRVTWPGFHVINATEAANFTVDNFLFGYDWLPRSGVPYANGL
ncbi:Pectinesterase [Bertholletia excelsa]